MGFKRKKLTDMLLDDKITKETYIAEADMLHKFDRVVFESIVEKVIAGDKGNECCTI